jgi:hypothetical protein
LQLGNKTRLRKSQLDQIHALSPHCHGCGIGICMMLYCASRSLARLSAVIATLGLASPAIAWGEFAHRLTARIANAEFTPGVQEEVRRILAASGSGVDTPECPLASIEDASVWPDCIRGEGDRFGYSARWHYQNISICGSFDTKANCVDGNCVTAQIPRQLAIVADRRRSDAARAQALAFVVHLVGDLHMPLHVGDRDDRGGNNVRVDYGSGDGGDRMNLHHLWDVELARRALAKAPAITPFSPTRAERRDWAQGQISDWARQSWGLGRSVSYGDLHNYPDACVVGAPYGNIRAAIDKTYVNAATPVIRVQVERAGVRIATLLNAALAR